MGCCSSGASSPGRAVVQHEGKSLPFPNTPTLASLKAAVASSLPDVKSPIALTNAEGVPFTDETYSKAIRQTTELKVMLKVLKPQEFSDIAWVPIAESVFKIEGSDGRVRGTGFLATKNYALTTGEALKGANLADVKATFDLPKPQSVKFDPNFIVNLNAGTGENVVLLRMQQSLIDKTGISLTLNAAHNEGDVAVLLHYSTKMPVLRAVMDNTIQKFDPVRILCSKSIDLGATGAPLMDSHKRLIGIYAGGTPGVALNSSWIVKTLQTLILTLGNAEKAAVNEVLSASNLSGKDSIPRPMEADRVKRVAEPIGDPLDSISISDEESQSDPKFAYAIDFAKDVISLFDGSGYLLRKVSLEHKLLPGISCLMTPFGLIATGPDAHTRKNAYLVTAHQVEQLDSTAFDHSNHASVWFKEEVVIISGAFTPSLEKLKEPKAHWAAAGVLPEKRAAAPALVYGDIIYLLGGTTGEGRPALNSILAGSGETWTTLAYELPAALKGLGAILLAENHKVVLFGGFAANNEANERVWELTLGQGTAEAKGTFKFAGQLHGFQATAFANQMAMVSSDSGAMYSYHTGKGRFKLLQNEASAGV